MVHVVIKAFKTRLRRLLPGDRIEEYEILAPQTVEGLVKNGFLKMEEPKVAKATPPPPASMPAGRT